MLDKRWSDEIELERRRKIGLSKLVHGFAVAAKGTPEHRTFRVWCTMRQRCLDPNSKSYARYGGRGIKVCPEWGDFLMFLADMGLAPAGKQIDRIDNDGDYEPRNCRWATRQEQARNRRTSHILSINGQDRTLAEWADISGVASSTIRARIRYGMKGEALISPTDGRSLDRQLIN